MTATLVQIAGYFIVAAAPFVIWGAIGVLTFRQELKEAGEI